MTFPDRSPLTWDGADGLLQWSSVDRRRELGDYLRSKRESMSPGDVGLPTTGHRRTPGLRREEVALLAGVSVSWYTWLEQGRRINASRDVLLALARALRLDDAGRAHVLGLAGAHASEAPDPAPDDVPDALGRLIASLEPAPAYVLDPCWYFVAWNRPQALLYPAIVRLPPLERNLLWALFCDPTTRQLVGDWDAQARRMLAEFRAFTTTLHADPRVTELVERLRAASPEFRAWWAEHDVATFQTRLRTYHHPRAGRLVFEYQQLSPAEWPGLRVVCQLPLPGDDSAQRLSAWHDVA